MVLWLTGLLWAVQHAAVVAWKQGQGESSGGQARLGLHAGPLTWLVLEAGCGPECLHVAASYALGSSQHGCWVLSRRTSRDPGINARFLQNDLSLLGSHTMSLFVFFFSHGTGLDSGKGLLKGVNTKRHGSLLGRAASLETSFHFF